MPRLSRRRAGTGRAAGARSTTRKATWPARICHSGLIARADGLGDADDDAAGKRAPQAAEPADDHRLEGIDQPRRPDGRDRNWRACRERTRRSRDHAIAMPMASAKTRSVVDAHQLRRLGIVGGGAEGAAERGAVEELVERDDDERSRTAKVRSGMTPTVEPAPSASDAGLERAGLEAAAVGGEGLEQPVLDDDRQAEGDEQRRQDVAAERAVEQDGLQRVAEREHQRHGDERRRRAVAGRARGASARIRKAAKHDEVAMGEIDEPHDAEDRATGRARKERSRARRAGTPCDERVEPAQSSAVMPHSEIGGVDGVAREPRPAATASRGPPASSRRGRRRRAPGRCPARPRRSLAPACLDARQRGVDVADDDRAQGRG